MLGRARKPRYQAEPGNAYREALPHISLSRFQRGRASRHAFLRKSLGTRKKTVKCIEEKEKNR